MIEDSAERRLVSSSGIYRARCLGRDGCALKEVLIAIRQGVVGIDYAKDLAEAGGLKIDTVGSTIETPRLHAICDAGNLKAQDGTIYSFCGELTAEDKKVNREPSVPVLSPHSSLDNLR
jgi:hypothetical protein